jgi:hypothetical protein
LHFDQLLRRASARRLQNSAQSTGISRCVARGDFRIMSWIDVIRRLVTAVVLLIAVPCAVHAQVVLKNERASLTIEAYANGVSGLGASGDRMDDAEWLADGAIRGLGLWKLPGLGRIGARVVGQGFAGAQDDLDVGERSIIWTGAFGRVEYGNRMGLPDVLTGYAPNPFTFTSAEFGPASGLSLDPGGGIVTRFLPSAVAPTIDALSSLGFTSSLFGDASRKLLYVSPKRAGFLGGVSYSSQADAPGAASLTQLGLAHETYWEQGNFRVGGSYARLRTDTGEELDSIYAGASVVLNDAWMLGLAATSNPDSSRTALPGWRSDALGYTTSLNWNRGAWTAGGFVQHARGRVSLEASNDRLRAAEVGVSYRTSTKLRIFAALYRYALDGADATRSSDDTLMTVGLRATR